jgi:N-acetylmuramoyl-L-alanine amidase
MKRRVFVGCACAIFLCAVAVSLGFDFKNRPVYARAAAFHVVIDAGHGGRDAGASSRGGVTERDINLAIAKFLKEELTRMGVGVTLTRESEYSLANPIAKNQKKSDMEARKKIIETVKPDLVISIHLNSLPAYPNVRGFQAFYPKQSPSAEISKQYANSVQTVFNSPEFFTKRGTRAADYFILECTMFPSILCECGFLSNAEDVKLLQTAEYQKIIAQNIALGVKMC